MRTYYQHFLRVESSFGRTSASSQYSSQHLSFYSTVRRSERVKGKPERVDMETATSMMKVESLSRLLPQAVL